MEARRKTTAGVLFWTPAPVRPSLNSSDDAWEDEDEGQPAREDDFESQMDENGIIGLSEVLEDVGLGEDCGAIDPDGDSGPSIKEEVDLSGNERTKPPEELNYNLSERLSNTESAGEETLPSCFDMIDKFKARTEDKKRHKHLDITEEEEGKRNGRKANKHESTPGKHGATNGLKKEISSTSSSLEPAGLSNHHCPVSVTSHSLLHLLHFTHEELAAVPGIEAETFPEMGFTESLSESHCSHTSLKLSPRRPQVNLEAFPQPEARVSEEVVSNHYRRASKTPGEVSEKSDHKQPRRTVNRSPNARYSRACSVSTVSDDTVKSKRSSTSSDRKPRSPKGRSKAAAENESRKAPVSHQTPDFSKVEPKIRFSNGSYKPPKSRLSATSDSLSPDPPLMFKSPADIVKEVLLNTDGSLASSDSDRSPAGATNSTVPLEFRSKQNATTLMKQLESLSLQEAHSILLTRLAEAENTIDRLRLEAKVNLYSDPPKPGHLIQARLNHNASKFVKLDFPQAQKADIKSPSLHPDEHSSHQGSSAACASPRRPVPDLGQQLASVIFSQTDKFLQQLQTFEHLLKSEKLKPVEQMKGLTQLSEGLDSLEKGYLLARDEHKVLQQRGIKISNFDPERELEGLIFQCGLRMDELKEQGEQMRQEHLTCEAPPTHEPASLFTLSMAEESLIHPQIPPEPLLVDPGEAAQAEVSSVMSESELEDEETLNSLRLNPPDVELRYVEQDFSIPDHYQSFKELPKLLDHSLGERLPPSAALETELQAEDKKDETLDQEIKKVWKTLPLSETTSDPPDSPADTSKQWSSRSSPPSHGASSQSTPVPPSSRSRLDLKKSHSSSLSSLGDIPADRMSSKGQTGSRRAHSQDGIISPEMDSGFVGSESSHLTPAAASSPVQQRASESSASVPQEGNSERPRAGLVSTPSSSSLHRLTATEPRLDSQFKQYQPSRTRPGQKRQTFSCSPQHWVSWREQTPEDNDSTPTGSEDSDRCCRTIDSLHSSPSSSSRPARYHHGNSQAANCDNAIQTLQAEVTRLKERLESCLKNKKPLSSVKAAPSTLNSSSPCIRSVEQRREASGERRETQSLNEVEEERVLRRTTRSASAQTQKPQQDLLRKSEPDSSPHPQVSRCTQTSVAPDSSWQQVTSVRSRRTQTTDEPDSSRSRAFLCPRCLSGPRGRTERPAGGVRESTLPSSRCPGCPLCGCLEPNRCTEPDCRRHSESPNKTTSRRYCAAEASPGLLEYRPVGPTPLLLFPSPLYVSPTTRSSSPERGRRRRSLSVDKLLSVDGSLNRAIRAAQNMKHTSRNMAQSLATGLQYQEMLTQSCS
ncbi:microtubule organization protein AKNA isoform X2 [Acanthochromis polyacanthus]|uniref:microtubule organization protein AKNA isoform X2 n=1 Tax=Acanthochromis polyacanthus TaxID=80966 RepID=UPI000B8FFD06|nr:microtubule organization protein AKNA isoform X2 [Acanthochromis polyacanthus]